eukprot:m.130921 g.130921  ORF g.130921 m.130921 type:complete len:434 (+) comp16446_c1_seq4:1672-2973(+)
MMQDASATAAASAASAATADGEAPDVFMKAFKQYKSRHPPPDLKDVIDVSRCQDSARIERVTLQDTSPFSDAEVDQEGVVGLRPVSEWQVFAVGGKPGFLLVRNALSARAVRHWVRRTLQDFICESNASNLDLQHGGSAAVLGTGDNNLWRRAERARAIPHANTEDHEDAGPQQKRERLQPSSSQKQKQGHHMHVPAAAASTAEQSAKPAAAATPTEETSRTPAQTASQTAADIQARAVFGKLRWLTLGYHYDWTNNVYDRARYTPFPADLAALCRVLAARLPLPATQAAQATQATAFKAEAAIVNFYYVGSTLAGHTDHAEFDFGAPILSLSFGLPAVFLLGGRTKQEPPVPLYVRNGDIVVMAGESRLCYHAVPAVLRREFDPQPGAYGGVDLEAGSEEAEWRAMERYLQETRININVRQVSFPEEGERTA